LDELDHDSTQAILLVHTMNANTRKLRGKHRRNFMLKYDEKKGWVRFDATPYGKRVDSKRERRLSGKARMGTTIVVDG